MESLEASAKNVEDAIQLALKKLGVTRDEVEVTILTEGRSGILGLGAEDARVLVTLKEEPAPVEESLAMAESEDVADVASEVLEELLNLMSVKASVRVSESDDSEEGMVNLDVSGDDLGILIGRRGETLYSLQFITNLIVGKRTGYRSKVSVDVEGYRRRREDSLRGLALRMADRVRQSRQSITLEAMPPSERRIVHLTLADDPYVSTQSIGDDEDRKVVISPKRL